MALSNDLISQFVKVTRDNEQTKNESTAYGKIVKQGDTEYVQLDGSELLTPISATTVVKDGDRVMVTIKNHTAVVTGDFTNPSASNKDVVEIGNKISDFEIIIADKISTKQLEAEIARIENLQAENIKAVNAEIETINGKVAKIDKIETDIIEVNGKIEAHEGEFTTIRGDIADFKDLTAENFEAVEGNFNNLNSDYATFKQTTTDKFTANDASINELETKKLNTETANITYATIDFSNIGEAAVEKLFSDSGIIRDLIMSDGKVTGELIGVTIKGDLIEGNTVKADKLVILGEDGIYYKLNVNSLGETVASSDEKYQNGLDGSNIIAKSITADRVAVTDLVAFGATIGGYHITKNSLYSGVKESVSNTTRGVFLGDDGQLAIGDANNYLKFFVDGNGVYKLELQANSIKFGANNTTIDDAINNIEQKVDDIEIGGRNYLRETRNFTADNNRKIGWQNTHFTITTEEDFVVASATASGLTNNTIQSIHSNRIDINLIKNKTVCVSFDIKVEDVDAWDVQIPFIWEYFDSSNTRVGYRDMNLYFKEFNINSLESNVWTRLICEISPDFIITYSNGKTLEDVVTAGVRLTLFRNGTVYYRKAKLEIGNKATDWTPAPEDVDSNIANIEDNIENRFNEVDTSIQSAQSTIDQLSNMISHLVTDANGESLMTQTSNGWTFNMSSINENLNAIKDAMVNMESDQNNSDSALEKLTNLVNEVVNKTAYITMSTDDNGDPCIELGKSDSLFKVRITNQAIDFLEGSARIAYANNNTFYSETMIVKNNLQIGEGPGFAWQTRISGNMGLTYVPAPGEVDGNLWNKLFKITSYNGSPVINNNPTLTFSGTSTGNLYANLSEKNVAADSALNVKGNPKITINPGQTLTIDMEIKHNNIKTCSYGLILRSSAGANYTGGKDGTYTIKYGPASSSVDVYGVALSITPTDETGYNLTVTIKSLTLS